MTRWTVMWVGFTLALGFALGWMAKQGLAKPTAPAHVSPPPPPVSEISVSRPDPEKPGEHLSTRLRVTHDGTNAKPAGKQTPEEWGVVLWYASEDPQRSSHYFGVPVQR